MFNKAIQIIYNNGKIITDYYNPYREERDRQIKEHEEIREPQSMNNVISYDKEHYDIENIIFMETATAYKYYKNGKLHNLADGAKMFKKDAFRKIREYSPEISDDRVYCINGVRLLTKKEWEKHPLRLEYLKEIENIKESSK